MKLTEEQIAKIKSKLSYAIDSNQLKCPVCNRTDGFKMHALECQITAHEREGNTIMVDQFKFLKAIPCSCKRCGFIAVFDLDVLLKE